MLASKEEWMAAYQGMPISNWSWTVMNHAKMPSTVADAERMIKIQRLSCTSGHWYRRRVSRYITSVAMSRARKKESGGGARSGLIQQTASLRKHENSALLAQNPALRGEIYICNELERVLGGLVLFLRRLEFVN